MPTLLDYRGTSEISPGQAGLQAAANWSCAEIALGGQTDSQVYSSSKKTFQGQHTYPVFHWLIGCYNNEWTSLNLSWLGLGGQTVNNLRRLGCKSQPSQIKAVAGWSKVSTSKYLQVRLARIELLTASIQVLEKHCNYKQCCPRTHRYA